MTYTIKSASESYAKTPYTGATINVGTTPQSTSYGIAQTSAPYSLFGWYGTRSSSTPCYGECFRVAAIFTGTVIALTVQSAGNWRVLVDGAVCGSRIISTTTAGQVISVTFAVSGTHTVEFWGTEGLKWSSLTHNGTTEALASKPKIAIIGDSWIDNTWTLTSYPECDGGLDGAPYYLSLLLDADVYADGLNGAGYASHNGRWSMTRPIGAEVTLIWGSINDGANSYSTEQGLCSSLYSAIQTDTPTTKLVVFGAQSATAGGTITPTSASAAILDTARANPFVKYVGDPIGESWLDDSRVRTHLGPAWIYGAHPNANGGLLMAKKFAAGIATLS